MFRTFRIVLITLMCASLYTVQGAEPFFCDFSSLQQVDSLFKRSHWSGGGRVYDSTQVWVDSLNGHGVFKMNASNGEPPVCGELESRRQDFFLGTYRASIKTTPEAGAVEGFFLYRGYNGNVHNEVDIEILTNNPDTVWCTLHYKWNQSYPKRAKIDFDPSADFHEYRFDVYNDKVVYYFDSTYIFTLDSTNLPDTESLMLINHWSNNSEGWGGQAPKVDTYMYIDYVFYSPDYDAKLPVTGETPINTATKLTPVRDNNKTLVEYVNSGYSGPVTIFDTRGRICYASDHLSQKGLSEFVQRNAGVLFAKIENRIIPVLNTGKQLQHLQTVQ